MIRNKLNKLVTDTPPGAPLGPADLHSLGISADLAVHYARAGWLMRLARGVYCRPNVPLALEPSLLLLQRKYVGLHVGGQSALEWRDVRHYVVRLPMLHLYGWKASRLPHWFTQRFPADYHRKRLFEEESAAPRHVAPLERTGGAPLLSVPERALLELLSEVGVRRPQQEARRSIESSHELRSDVLRDLLEHCTSVKTVRLCVQLGRECSLPWAAALDPRQLPTGSGRRWISRSPEGLLVLKP
jgi:Transcriptional regulator, AbiEi antitoxin, Type IV TA system/Transcriptional regulator, AbiEi antitoxin N-terminal domain